MKPLFEVRDIDRAFYEERLRDFLPRSIIDFHTHVWEKPRVVGADRRCVSWPARVAAANPLEHLLETYSLLLPGKEVSALMFANVPDNRDLDDPNRYVADCARRAGFPALLFSHPSWPPEELEQRLESGGFIGVKSYLSLAPEYLPGDEIRIFDFFPLRQIEVLNRRRGVVMLHIPRKLRLRDPVNLAQMLVIEERFPDVTLVVAHAGRAYCVEDVGDAFETLKPAKRMLFDISANTNRTVFKMLLDAAGPERVLFGSDLPILRMRMRRICENGRYVNLVPPGLYGDVSGDPNMREVSAEEGSRLSFFLYEELEAFRLASADVGLGPRDIERVFYGNAARIIGVSRGGGTRG